jgi:hypothetical protein
MFRNRDMINVRIFQYPHRLRLITWLMIGIYLISLTGICLTVAWFGDGHSRLWLTSTIIFVPFGAIALYLYRALVKVYSWIYVSEAAIGYQDVLGPSISIPWTAIIAVEYREDCNRLVIRATAPYSDITMNTTLMGFDTLAEIIDQRLTYRRRAA